MTTQIKICGLTTAAALDAALEARADFVGFVFFPASPRHLAPARARELAAHAQGRARKVALTVDADDGLLDEIATAVHPDMLQLHGREAPARVADLRRRFGFPVMKVLPIADAADLALVNEYEAVADWLLFDARPPKDATRPGGLGRPFDWSLLKRLDCSLPFMLSGGLDPLNVGQALAVTRAPAVDVSSGVESAPGRKDPEKIRAFVHAVRAASASEMAAADVSGG